MLVVRSLVRKLAILRWLKCTKKGRRLIAAPLDLDVDIFAVGDIWTSRFDYG